MKININILSVSLIKLIISGGEEGIRNFTGIFSKNSI